MWEEEEEEEEGIAVMILVAVHEILDKRACGRVLTRDVHAALRDDMAVFRLMVRSALLRP